MTWCQWHGSITLDDGGFCPMCRAPGGGVGAAPADAEALGRAIVASQFAAICSPPEPKHRKRMAAPWPGGKPRWNGQRPSQVGPTTQTRAADTQTAGAKRSRFRYEWQSAFCAVSDTSRETGLPPTTRLVLWTVSRYMNPDGAGAYPGQARIARDAGLSLLAAKIHLRLAEKRGWLKRDLTFKSQYGTGFEYAATIPEGATTLPPPGNDVTQSIGTGQRQHKTRVTTLPQPVGLTTQSYQAVPAPAR